MAAPSRSFAVACLALFAVMAAGCMISRPCNWEQWRYQSSDGQYRGHDDWDGSPPIVLDQQARTRPRYVEDDRAPRVAAHSEKSSAKPKLAQKPVPAAVAQVQWQEPNDPPPSQQKDRKRPPKRTAKPVEPSPAKPAALAHPAPTGPSRRADRSHTFQLGILRRRDTMVRPDRVREANPFRNGALRTDRQPVFQRPTIIDGFA